MLCSEGAFPSGPCILGAVRQLPELIAAARIHVSASDLDAWPNCPARPVGVPCVCSRLPTPRWAMARPSDTRVVLWSVRQLGTRQNVAYRRREGPQAGARHGRLAPVGCVDQVPRRSAVADACSGGERTSLRSGASRRVGADTSVVSGAPACPGPLQKSGESVVDPPAPVADHDQPAAVVDAA